MKIKAIKKFGLFLVILSFLFIPSLIQADGIISAAMNPTNPGWGQQFTLNISYCVDQYNAGALDVAISTSSTPQTTNTAGQVFLVSNLGIDVHSANPSPSGGNIGYNIPIPSPFIPNCTECSAGTGMMQTVQYTLTMPNAADMGSASCGSSITNLNLIVGLENSIMSWTAMTACDYKTLSWPLPTPPVNSISVNKTVNGTLALVGDLVLYEVNYTYANGSAAISDPIPGGGCLALVDFGPNPAPTGGSVTAPAIGSTSGTLSWTFPASAYTKSGSVWMLLQMTCAIATGTVINNTATGTSGSNESTSSASLTVGTVALSLQKSQSINTFLKLPGATVTETYYLDYQINGDVLKAIRLFDDNANGSSSTTPPPGWKFLPFNGTNGTWTISDTCNTGDRIITGSVPGIEDYPDLLLDNPANESSVQMCDSGVIESDVMINPGNYVGSDALIIIRSNGQTGNLGYAFSLLLSLDTAPAGGYVSIQQCGGGMCTWPAYVDPANLVITPNTWYRVKIVVSNNGFHFQAKVWQLGQPEPTAYQLDWTDTSPDTTNPNWECPDMGGTNSDWRPGIGEEGNDQDGSTQDSYNNFLLYNERVSANTVLYDTIPTGLTYSGSNPSGATAGNMINWSLGNISDQSGSYTWWATTSACSESFTNVAGISGNGVDSPAAQFSNQTVFNVVCASPTVTVTPTPSPAFTIQKTSNYTANIVKADQLTFSLVICNNSGAITQAFTVYDDWSSGSADEWQYQNPYYISDPAPGIYSLTANVGTPSSGWTQFIFMPTPTGFSGCFTFTMNLSNAQSNYTCLWHNNASLAWNGQPSAVSTVLLSDNCSTYTVTPSPTINTGLLTTSPTASLTFTNTPTYTITNTLVSGSATATFTPTPSWTPTPTPAFTLVKSVSKTTITSVNDSVTFNLVFCNNSGGATQDFTIIDDWSSDYSADGWQFNWNNNSNVNANGISTLNVNNNNGVVTISVVPTPGGFTGCYTWQMWLTNNQHLQACTWNNKASLSYPGQIASPVSTVLMQDQCGAPTLTATPTQSWTATPILTATPTMIISAGTAPKIESVSMNPANPGWGQQFAVTVQMCIDGYNTPNELLVAVSTNNTFQPPDTGGQIFLVSRDGINVPDVNPNNAMGGNDFGFDIPQPSPFVADCTDCNGGAGQGMLVTETYNLTMPSAQQIGTACGATMLNLLVGTQTLSFKGYDWAALTNGSCNANVTTWTLPVPPADSITMDKRVEGVLQSVGDLVLFSIDYTYGNGPLTITDPLPGGGDLALVSIGPSSITGGTVNSPAIGATTGTVTWTFPTSTYTKQGTVWLLMRMTTAMTSGTQVPNTATGTSGSNNDSASATITVGGAAISVQKMESMNSLVKMPGDSATITYYLNYQVNGDQLKDYRAFDDTALGTYTNPTPPSGWEFMPDNTDYGTWTISDPCNIGDRILTGAGQASSYPALLLNDPNGNTDNVQICTGVVEADVFINPGTYPGADGLVILRDNGLTGTLNYGYSLLLSIDTAPSGGYMAIQKCGGGACTYGGASSAITITGDTWYRTETWMTTDGTSYTFQSKVWQIGQPEPTGYQVIWTDTGAASQAAWNCSGTGTYTDWRPGVGNQSGDGNGTVLDSYNNFIVLVPRVAANVTLFDTVPTGLTYSGSNPAGTDSGGIVSWNLGNISDQSGSYTWWASTSACNEAFTNVGGIGATGLVTEFSNPVVFNVSCTSPTITVTFMPTMAWTATATLTPTVPVFGTASFTPTYTITCDCLTGTFTPTYTVTPTYTITATPMSGTITVTFMPTMAWTSTPTVTATTALPPNFTINKTVVGSANMIGINAANIVTFALHICNTGGDTANQVLLTDSWNSAPDDQFSGPYGVSNGSIGPNEANGSYNFSLTWPSGFAGNSCQDFTYTVENYYLGSTYWCMTWPNVASISYSGVTINSNTVNVNHICPSSTDTYTVTPTNTCTITMTLTPSKTITATPTSSQVPQAASATATPTINIQQASPTATATPPHKRPRPYPNPINPHRAPELIISYYFTPGIDRVTIRIYTAAFRLVKQHVFEQAEVQQMITQGYLSLDISELEDLSEGIYYYVIITDNQGMTERSEVDKLIILK
jgi:hypothetical protein